MAIHGFDGAITELRLAVPVPDLDRTMYIMLLGANPHASNGSLCTAPDFPGRLDRIQERVFIVHLINDKNDPTRIAGAAGFSVRENKIYIYKAKAILLAAGGCVN